MLEMNSSVSLCDLCGENLEFSPQRPQKYTEEGTKGILNSELSRAIQDHRCEFHRNQSCGSSQATIAKLSAVCCSR
jgi:hypothetical protein